MTASPVHILKVPYDSAHRAERMGAGPEALGPAVIGALPGATEETVEAPAGFATEVSTGIALARALSTRVRAARTSGRRPIVLAGNCLSALGTVSGTQEGDDDLAVVWLDAHGDLETPGTTTSGFVDGMALATVMGRCWSALTASVPDFRPVPGERVILVGVRDVSAAEETLIAESGMAWVQADRLRHDASALDAALAIAAMHGARRAYVHVDLDVHDPAEVPANGYPAPGGLGAAVVRDVVRRVADRLGIAAAALTAYDPSGDPERRTVAVARELAPLLAR